MTQTFKHLALATGIFLWAALILMALVPFVFCNPGFFQHPGIVAADVVALMLLIGSGYLAYKRLG